MVLDIKIRNVILQIGIYFFNNFDTFFIFDMSFMPVLRIIGFLYLDIKSIKGKLLHSPDPILKPLTPILYSFSAACFEKGVLKYINFFFYIFIEFYFFAFG